MKKSPLLLILFSILLSKGLQAQNYQTVNSGRISYFTTSSEDFQFLRIDSVFFNGDSVFYPNRSIDRISDENDYPVCYSPFQPSWAGSKIIVREDGSNIYFNRDNDSIVIKTSARQNDKWISYRKGDSILIWAEVIACDTVVVLGQVDSVKTIRFQVFDSTGVKLNHPYNNVTAEISKSFGWVKSPNFNYFPTIPNDDRIPYSTSFSLVGINNPRLGVQNLTWFEVFDFQPGDVIHVKDSYLICGNNWTSNIRKYIYTYLERTDYADSIIYIIDRKQQETERADKKYIQSFFHDTIRSVIVDNPAFNKFSYEPIIDKDGNSSNINIQYISNYGGYGLTKVVSQSHMFKAENQCWNFNYSHEMGGAFYIKGLGGSYFYGISYNGCDKNDEELVYYKKGDITWGTPLDLTDVDVLVKSNDLKVYPNPASDKICIETNSYNNPVTFELYSSGGNLVHRQIIHSAKQDVDMKSFENGIYFYKVSTAEQILINGKITILH